MTSLYLRIPRSRGFYDFLRIFTDFTEINDRNKFKKTKVNDGNRVGIEKNSALAPGPFVGCLQGALEFPGLLRRDLRIRIGFWGLVQSPLASSRRPVIQRDFRSASGANAARALTRFLNYHVCWKISRCTTRLKIGTHE